MISRNLFAVAVAALSLSLPAQTNASQSTSTSTSMTTTTEPSPVAVPTFESIGLYWKATAPVVSGNDSAQLQYRLSGATQWSDGLPMWFDEREGEYRGSLVRLKPDSDYEVKTTLDNSKFKTITAHTWSENFPIAKTVTVANSTQPLVITQSGTASGYTLYTPAAASTATINVGKNYDFPVQIKGNYVIVRGLTLVGGKKGGIGIGDTTTTAYSNIVIEGNDVSGWGTNKTIDTRFGQNLQGGITAKTASVSKLVVQRNKLHNPSTDSNSWEEYNGTTYHPEGPQGIVLQKPTGQLVIRYNEIYSDADHYFNDGMGGTNNFSDAGFPNRDADIYGNYIRNCWDDAIESEGANRNVRIWGNYLDHMYIPFGIAATYGGPLYNWQNVVNSTSSGPANAQTSPTYKMRNRDGSTTTDWGGGRVYIFNNTVLQPSSGGLGMESFIKEAGFDDKIREVRALNNIAQVRSTSSYSFKDSYGSTNKFDYDLANGKRVFSSPQESHGIVGSPKYVSGAGFSETARTGTFSLDSLSPGYDSGTLIPNFIETYTGRGPDMGAHEAMTNAMQFGVKAYAAP